MDAFSILPVDGMSQHACLLAAGLAVPCDLCCGAHVAKEIPATPGEIQHKNIFGRFHLVVTEDPATVQDVQYSYFSVDGILSYIGFCDDFGPMSIATVYEFCKLVEQELSENPNRPVAMITNVEMRTLTNSVLLIGAYMIMKLGMPPDDIVPIFDYLSFRLGSYRDVSPGEQNFSLQLKDCWAGLFKAKQLQWIDFGPEGFNLSEYVHLDDPLNADLHEIVPGKFIAMRGPKDLPGGALWQDIHTEEGTFSHRNFSPSYYGDILQLFNVQAVARLNVVEYSQRSFADHGIAVAELFFEDCTTPPVDVVAKFMMIAEGLPGALAVHCKAGLGRTGTLICLYMMKHYGFTAREAMGWIRIVRPGSVIGTQQHFLCEEEALMHRAGDKFRREGAHLTLEATADMAAVQRFIARVHAHIDQRVQAALAAASPSAPPPPPLQAGRQQPAQDRPGKDGPHCLPNDSDRRLAAHVSAAADRRTGIRSAGRGPPAAADSACESALKAAANSAK